MLRKCYFFVKKKIIDHLWPEEPKLKEVKMSAANLRILNFVCCRDQGESMRVSFLWKLLIVFLHFVTVNFKRSFFQPEIKSLWQKPYLVRKTIYFVAWSWAKTKSKYYSWKIRKFSDLQFYIRVEKNQSMQCAAVVVVVVGKKCKQKSVVFIFTDKSDNVKSIKNGLFPRTKTVWKI